jgi:hypothetical protein
MLIVFRQDVGNVCGPTKHFANVGRRPEIWLVKVFDTGRGDRSLKSALGKSSLSATRILTHID